MFELPAVEWSTTTRSSGALWLSEVVATVGLLLVIHGCVRSGRASAVAFAVGVWIGGAYCFTSSTSFANPAVTIARTMSDSFAGIKPSSAPMFIVMQLIGAAIAFVPDPLPLPPARRPLMHSPNFEALPLDQQNLVNHAAARLEREFAGTYGPRDHRAIHHRLTRPARPDRQGHDVSAAAHRALRPGTTRRRSPRSKDSTQSISPSVLFMCVHNAGRSQMAAGWLRHLAGDRITVYSGGSEPTDQINPAAVAAMAEVGIDITNEFPKPWTDEIVRASDVVVTMGCGDACPLFPGKRYEDWQLDDPAGRDVAAVRPIRDEIRLRVEELMASLGITAAQGRTVIRTRVGLSAFTIALWTPSPTSLVNVIETSTNPAARSPRCIR